MSREEAKQLLVELGIAEPTDESVSKMLNSIGKNSQAKDDLLGRQKSRIAELEALTNEQKKSLEEIENSNLSDIDKLQKQIEKLTAEAEADKAKIRTMNLKNGFAEKGIVGEDADKLVESLTKGEFDFETLGKIIADRETKSASAKEKELLDGTQNPNGSDGKGKDNPKDDYLKSIGQSLAGTSDKSSLDIVSQYI